MFAWTIPSVLLPPVVCGLLAKPKQAANDFGNHPEAKPVEQWFVNQRFTT
jgi:hypothetical protein